MTARVLPTQVAYPLPQTIRPPYNLTWPPDYVSVLAWRQQQILRLRSDPSLIVGALEYYKDRPVDFINHWCTTYDPRLAISGRPPTMPFILYQRQEEFIEFVVEACLRPQENGLSEKTREVGATWLCCGISTWLWRYWRGASIGWGSREQDLVDKIGDPDAIFEKMRIIIRNWPPEFLPRGFSVANDMSFMRIVNPENDATITGDIGDNIGRGGRKLIYFFDEAAHVTHPEMAEAALSETTRCRIDISSVDKPGNVFHRRREAGVDWYPGADIPRGKTRVFVFDWRDHPEKTQEWYDLKKKRAEEEGLTTVFAREIDRDYFATQEGVVIKRAWVQAAIDAHIKLGFEETGRWCTALDVADAEEGDTNAWTGRQGVILREAEEWGARDPGVTARRAFQLSGAHLPCELRYDVIGLGTNVRSEGNRLQDEEAMPRGLRLIPWHAGASVVDPNKPIVQSDGRDPREKLPTNEEFFANLKAQAWFNVARRFERTWRAVNDPNFRWQVEDLISIDSRIPLLRKIEKELCQVTMGQGARLKQVVNKKPDGMPSPNVGDSVIMNYFPLSFPGAVKISQSALAWSRGLGR